MKKLYLIEVLIFTQSFYAQFNYQRTWATYYGDEGTDSEGAVIDSQGNMIYI